MVLREIIDILRQDGSGSTFYERKKNQLALIKVNLEDYSPEYRPFRINRDLIPVHFRAAYDSLYAGYSEMKERIKIPSKNRMGSDEIMSVHNAVLSDNPQLYYLDPLVSFLPGDHAVVMPEYKMDKSEKRTIDSYLDSIVDSIYPDDSYGCFKRERIVSDYIKNHVSYGHNTDESRSHNVLGSLMDGMAVCDGISKGASFLLNRLGVPCSTISGQLEGEGHSWNIVEVGGERYHLDITNNNSNLPDRYYNSTDNEMSRTHILPFNCGCSDSSRLFDNRYISVNRSEIIQLMSGFFYSHDKELFFRISDGLSEPTFKTELNISMKRTGRSISCSYSLSEAQGLVSIYKQ